MLQVNKPFCDFCKCDDCKFGTDYLCHAETNDNGRWICDVCWAYDLCTSGPRRGNQPCETKECEHRPKLISEWIKYNQGEVQMCDNCDEHHNDTAVDDDENYPLPVDHPRLANVAGKVYSVVFEPINNFLDWINNGFVSKKKDK